MAVNYKKCPKYGSKNSVKIVYGMPSFKLFQEAEAGKVKLGGCCIIEGGPEYYDKGVRTKSWTEYTQEGDRGCIQRNNIAKPWRFMKKRNR
jgi:hypothetical protein